jgi:protein-S-isoprenylcysteine O-methyltransferase Ste14
MNSRLPALGPNGEGWVAAQLVLFGIIAFAGVRQLVGQGSASSAAAVLVGLGAITVGGVVATRGVWDLRHSFSVFPRPVAGGPLIESGAYRLIRHPIYSGLVLAAIGWGLVTGSLVVIGASGLLFLVFAGKSRREELWLSAEHPEYGAYQRRTKRLIPWIY